MLVLLLRRLAAAITMLLLITVATFVLLQCALAGALASDPATAPEIAHRLAAHYDPGLPVWKQFLRYLVSAAHGDLGPSMTSIDKDVGDIIADAAPVSLILGAAALALAVAGGSVAGVMAGLAPGRWRDRLVLALAFAGAALAPVAAAPLLQIALAARGGLLPEKGLYHDEFGALYFVLPTAALALPATALVAGCVRRATRDAAASEVACTARAKGLSERLVVSRYVLPVATASVIAQAGTLVGALLAGSLVVETVFQLPGLGRAFILAATRRDITTAVGVLLVFAALVVGVQLLADIWLRWLDPRARPWLKPA